MKQICISSDITSTHLTVNYDDLLDVKNLSLHSLVNDVPLVQIKDIYLELIKDELENTLSSFFLNRKDAAKANLRVTYLGEKYELDFRNDYDRHIYTLICLYDVIISSIRMAGSLFVYNKALLQKFQGDSIVAFLRAKGSLSPENILLGIKGLRKELELQDSLTQEILEQGLNNLQLYGMIDYNSRNNEYNLTARGYMFW